jgi:hypothetical protein
MKKIFILLSVAFFGMFGAFAQAPVIYTKMTAAGYEFKYLKIDSGLIVPFRDTLVYRNANQPGIMVYKPGSGFFGYNGTNWTALAGSGGATDTTSLSNRINQKLNIVDTANVRVRLSAGTNITSISGTYPNLTINAAGGSTDTTSLSNRINQKLDIVDTANIAFRPIAGANIELSGTYPNLTITGTGGSGGGSSINYYLNGSVNQGTFGGDIYYQLSQTPIIGGGTNFTRLNSSGNGYVASFITDAGQPNILNIPGGNWNLEFYFNSSSSGGSPQFYGEVYKYDGTTFSLIASGSTNPETITNGTTVDQYFTSIPMPQTTLLSTDRLAVRVYVITGGRNITLHTEDNNLSEVLTTINISAWKTSGNADVNASQFLGSTNNASLRFKTFGEDRMILDSIGRLQINGLVNNTSYPNALQLANKNGRSIFDITTSGTVTNLTIKANNNAIGDSLVISDTGLIQSRSNTSIWLKGNTTGTGNVNVNAWRSSLAGTGSIFSANVGTNTPIFNMLSTGQMSIGAETPVSTAALDITSTSRGLLIPRMTTSQRNAISSPASQLVVSNTTTNTIDMYQNGNWSTVAGDYADDVAAYRQLGSTIQAGPVPGIGAISTSITMFTGRGYWSAVFVKKPITITGIAWFQTVAGSYTATNYNGVALYSYSGGTLTLVDSSTRDAAIWTQTSGTWGSKALAGGTRTLAPGIYYLAAIYSSSAGTNPQIGTVFTGTSIVGYTAPLTTNSARISGWETSVTVPPTTKTMSSFSGQGIYVGLCLY